jgi:hypothetical protein
MIFLYFVLYAIAGAHIWHYYPMLPEKMATHFGVDGQPNGWMSKDQFAFFYIGFLIVVSGAFAVTGALATKLPDRMFRIPNKSYWFAPERAEETRKGLGRDLTFIGLFIGAFLIGIHHSLIDMALKDVQKLDTTLLLAWVGFLFTGMGLFIIRQFLRFRKPDDVK